MEEEMKENKRCRDVGGEEKVEVTEGKRKRNILERKGESLGIESER